MYNYTYGVLHFIPVFYSGIILLFLYLLAGNRFVIEYTENMNLDIPNKCLRCDRYFDWNEVIIGKMPENVFFCMDCITKFPDDKVYEGKDAWITTEYQPGLIISDE